MIHKQLVTAITAGVIAAGAVTAAAKADDTKPLALAGEKYAKDAKISLDEARTIALKAYVGDIVAQELEKEKGGSGLRYSFDIKNGRVTHEIGVDAKSGALLENSVEGAHRD